MRLAPILPDSLPPGLRKQSASIPTNSTCFIAEFIAAGSQKSKARFVVRRDCAAQLSVNWYCIVYAAVGSDPRGDLENGYRDAACWVGEWVGGALWREKHPSPVTFTKLSHACSLLSQSPGAVRTVNGWIICCTSKGTVKTKEGLMHRPGARAASTAKHSFFSPVLRKNWWKQINPQLKAVKSPRA